LLVAGFLTCESTSTVPRLGPVASAQSIPAAPPTICLVEGVATDIADCPGGALRAHAARLLGCDAGQLNLQSHLLGRAHNPSDYTFVEGCGERLVYMERPFGAAPQEYYVVSRFSLRPRPLRP
jgi:hypothetical protein